MELSDVKRVEHALSRIHNRRSSAKRCLMGLGWMPTVPVYYVGESHKFSVIFNNFKRFLFFLQDDI